MAHRPGRRPRLTNDLKRRLGRLLPMEYKPAEIAETLGVCKDTVCRGWVRAGAPHRRTDTGRIWIVGSELANWLRGFDRSGAATLEDGEAFCLSCQAAVRMQGPLDREVQGPAVLVRGTCPDCGGTVARFSRVEDSEEA
jgi:hypothetical protein